MLSGIFIDRPRLAIVISVVITIAGLVALTQIPIAQFPDIVPPQVSVTASYPGASAAVAGLDRATDRVAGDRVDRMIYMKSTSGNDGSYTLNVSFAVGTAPDINTVNVQNRVALAEAKLPQEARAGRQREEEIVRAAATHRAHAARRQPRSALPFQLCDDQYRRWPEAHRASSTWPC